MDYTIIKFHEVLYGLGIRGWSIPTAPLTEEFFLANFSRRTGMSTNDMGEPCEVMSDSPSDYGVTWSQITTKHAELLALYNNNAYQRTRASAYPNIGDQLDSLYHDILNNKLDKTGTWFTGITDVKNTTTLDEILLDGTDGSSTNAGDKVLLG